MQHQEKKKKKKKEEKTAMFKRLMLGIFLQSFSFTRNMFRKFSI